MKPYTRTRMMEELGKKFPGMFLRTSEEFYGYEEGTGIWTSGEDGPNWNEKIGLPIFDYWAMNYDFYPDGHVLYLFSQWLEERGWHVEWNDAGTVILYPR